jgi:hypothetical protein
VEIRILAKLEDVAASALGIVILCDAQIQRLRPQFGRDERKPRGQYNQDALDAVSKLAGALVDIGMAQDGARIRVGKVTCAREAILILAEWRDKCQAAWDEHRKRVASESQLQPADGPWSPPDSPAGWSKRFKVSWDTLKRRFKDGSIRYKKLSSKSYRIHLDDLPEK